MAPLNSPTLASGVSKVALGASTKIILARSSAGGRLALPPDSFGTDIVGDMDNTCNYNDIGARLGNNTWETLLEIPRSWNNSLVWKYLSVFKEHCLCYRFWLFIHLYLVLSSPFAP